MLMILTGGIAATVHTRAQAQARSESAPQTPTASSGTAANLSTPVPLARLPVVAPVDLQRYGGTWYEQARLPNRFQRQCAGQVSARYGLLADGHVSVLNRCVREDGSVEAASGRARVIAVPGQPDAGRLQVSFLPTWLDWLPMIWGDYWVLQLDAQYQVSLVGTPDRKYLWVLSRAQQLDGARLQAALDYAASLGFDTRTVLRTPSTPALPAPPALPTPAAPG